MGTNNFYNKNASQIYVVRDEDCVFYGADYAFIADALQELLPQFNIQSNHTMEKHGLRNFPGVVLGTFESDWIDLDPSGNDYYNYQVMIPIILRAGYYAHGNLDYEFTFNFDFPGFACSEYDIDVSEFLEIDDCGSYDRFHQFVKAINTHRDTMIAQIEVAFAQISEPYCVLAQFSNGEAIYSKAE